MNSGMNVTTLQSDEWQTPDWLFQALDAEFGFDFDAAASHGNNKCARYTDNIEADMSDIADGGHIVFCNPPYSKISLFVTIAMRDAVNTWVLLLPARTDNSWFHTMGRSPRVVWRFYRKRIKFLEGGVEMGSPRFASMLAVIR